MNPFREFLEASNLHGLVHISKAQSKWGKVLWSASVFVSFSLAGILINNSFEEWSARPISSVISTQTIKNLRFPNVTVCPPKGTNTALNYDLTGLNRTFKPTELERIKEETISIFTGIDRKKYVKDMLQVVNPENLKKIYKGFHTMPSNLNKTGFRVELLGSEGEIRATSKDKYNTMFYTLKFPENLAQLVGGTGKLIIEMQMGSKGEKVEYREGPLYEYVPDKLYWQEAEDHCVEKGGHLATPTSDVEIAAAYSATNFESYHEDGIIVWLGGKRNELSQKWAWVSGKDWVYDDWMSDEDPNEDNCLSAYLRYFTLEGTWYKSRCRSSYITGFICEYRPDEIIRSSKEISFKPDNLPSTPLQIWWKRDMSSDLTSTENRRKIHGLTLKWRVENKFPDLEMISSQWNGYVETPDFGGQYEEELYMANRRAKFTLQLPDNLKDASENSTLVVNLQTVIAEDPEWKENVVFRIGPTLNFHSERKSWEEAERICAESGSHLASVENFDEYQDLRTLDIAGQKQVWLGGMVNKVDGNWTWVDGKEWSFTFWDTDPKYPQNERKNTRLVMFESRVWRNYPPKAKFPFVCRNSGKTITSASNYTWEYKAKEMISNNITVVWEYKFTGQELKSPKRTGFSVSWFLADSDGNQREYSSTGTSVWNAADEVISPFTEETKWFVYFVNIAQTAIVKGIDHGLLMTQLVNFRSRNSLGSNFADCMNGIISDKSYLKKFVEEVNLTFIGYHEYDKSVHSNISQTSLLHGLELLLSLQYCPQNLCPDMILQDFFLQQKNPRALLQGTANVINSGIVVNPVSMEHLRKFCQMLQAAFKMDLKWVLSKTLSNSNKEIMIRDKNPFLLFNSSSNGQPEPETEIDMARLSSHPVHLTSRGALSAFIPFCAYNTDLLAFGQYIDGLQFPVCNKFAPTVHRGQLCYTIDVNSELPNSKIEKGKIDGLTLVLDYNEERSVSPIEQRQKNKTDKRYLQLKTIPDGGDNEAKIVIHTLNTYENYGGGIYSMNALKQISPTENFLKLPKDVTGCKNHDELLCKMTEYLKQKRQSCNCVPWEFPKKERTDGEVRCCQT